MLPRLRLRLNSCRISLSWLGADTVSLPFKPVCGKRLRSRTAPFPLSFGEPPVAKQPFPEAPVARLLHHPRRTGSVVCILHLNDLDIIWWLTSVIRERRLPHAISTS